MVPKVVVLFGFAMSSGLLLGAEPKAPEPSDPNAAWVWHLKVDTPLLYPPEWLRPEEGKPQAKAVRPGAQGQAIVEVWGESVQETLHLFTQGLYPKLARSFAVGQACTNGYQELADFMAQARAGGEILAPAASPTYYNCLCPTALDPKLVAYTTLGGP